MLRRKPSLFVLTVFLAGLSTGLLLAKKKDKGLDPSTWSGKEPAEAAATFLEMARDKAGKGSWERIAVARVHYLAGNTDEAEAAFAELSGAKAEASDLIRIVRVYVEAGQWEKAKPLADRVLEMEPDDLDWLVEVGAYYNVNGDRERAEELFARSLTREYGLGDLLEAGGSYLGVLPD